MNDRSEFDNAVRRADLLERQLAIAQAALAECGKQTEKLKLSASAPEYVDDHRLEAEELRLVYETAPIGLALLGRDLRFRRVNKRFAEMSGFPVAEHVGKEVSEIVPKNLADFARDVTSRILETGEGVSDSEVEGETCAKPGVLRNWIVHWRPLKDETGWVWGINVVVEEITARKQSEEVLREREAFTSRILATSLNGLYIYDLNLGRHIFINEQYTRLTGYRLDDIIAMGKEGFWGVFHPEDQPIVASHIDAIAHASDEEVIEFEYRARIADGRWIWVLSRDAVFARNPDGAVSQLIGSFLDITERKRTEQDLRESERRLRLITDGLPVLIAYVDQEEHYQFANAAYERWFGLPHDRMIGRPVVEIIGKPAYERLHDQIRQALEGKRVRFLAQVPYERGPQRDIEAVYLPHRDDEGRVLGFYALVQDISELMEHKRSEEALRESEERLALSQEVGGIGSFDWHVPSGRVTWSEALERLYGLEPGEFQGTYQDWFSRVHPGERAAVEKSVRDAIEQRREWRAEYPIVRKDGAVRWIYGVGRALFDEDGQVTRFLGVKLDITEHREAEQALRDANRRLGKTLSELRATQEQVIQAEKVVALGTMAAGIAHELNNPLMGVMGFVNYARRHPTDPTADELLLASEHELGRMRDLIRSLLTFARPSEEKPSAVDIPRLITRAVQLLGADLKARGIAVKVEMDDGLSRVTATPQLEQAILNLLLNARDAVTQVSEKIITIRSWSEGEEVFIEISDSGPGIPESIRNRIFDPFFTTKTPGEGTGLGLSVSRTVIQGMDGELTLESREGEETCFLVRLPKRQSPEGDPR